MCYLKINSRSLLQISVVNFKDGTSLGKDGEQSWRNMEFRMRTLCMCPITFNHIKNKPVWDGLSSLTWHVILLEEDGYKNDNGQKKQVGTNGPKMCKKWSTTLLHHQQLETFLSVPHSVWMLQQNFRFIWPTNIFVIFCFLTLACVNYSLSIHLAENYTWCCFLLL